MGDYLLIIDGSSLLSTQFFGNLPREILFAKTTEEKSAYFHKIMQTSKGVYTNAVYGFFRVLIKILKEQNPKYLAVAWDISRNTFRRELYPDYKGNRGETLEPLKEQFVLCQEVLKSIGIAQFMDERYEADDFAGTLTAMFEHDIPVRIMTKDQDYLQLVSEHTELWMIHSTSQKTEELYEKYGMKRSDYLVPDRTFPFTPELVEKEFGVKPVCVNSLKGLKGDSADNIKGVPGVGEMTAVALIHKYETVDALYQVIHQAETEAEKKKLADYWKNELGIKRSPMGALTKTSETELVGEKAARLSETLATIKRDVPLEITLDDLRVHINYDAAKVEFERLEFHSLKLEKEESDFVPAEDNPFDGTLEACPFPEESPDMPDSTKVENKTAEVKHPVPDYIEPGIKCCESFEINEEDEKNKGLFGQDKILSFYLYTEGEGISAAAFCGADSCVRVVMNPQVNTVHHILSTAVEMGMKLSTVNLKGQLPVLDKDFMFRLCREQKLYDMEIAAYLLNPLASSYDFDALRKQFWGLELPARKEVFGKLSGIQMVMFEPEKLKNYMGTGCHMISLLSQYLLEEITASGMSELYFDMEMPLLFALYDMQKYGIRVDREALKEYGKKLAGRIEQLEKKIYDSAGEKFNINSPKQLGVLLFEKLALPGGKKTKTGYSTAAEVLEAMSDAHPLIPLVLEYRQLTKLKSTYADGLDEFIREDGRIHGLFHQTVTATGRISSAEPNLQNIPIRMALGKELRKVFIPENGYVFIDADYSQIELRVLAHMSKDLRLIDAYRQDKDIHRITASEVFHTPFEEVTKEQRSYAKAVNFGIVYGISAFGLGQGLKISRSEAEEYMKQYFETYPGVRHFMEELVFRGRESRMSRTVFGRIRPLPDITSTNYLKRSAEERVAMNAPIQGTAADIIKIAMIRVHERLAKEFPESRLILQIHDELLIEAKSEDAQRVRSLLVEEMQHAADLLVPLEVSAEIGDNWLDAH